MRCSLLRVCVQLRGENRGQHRARQRACSRRGLKAAMMTAWLWVWEMIMLHEVFNLRASCRDWLGRP